MRKYVLKVVRMGSGSKFPYVEVSDVGSFSYSMTLAGATHFDSVTEALTALAARVRWSSERDGSSTDKLFRNDTFTIVAVDSTVSVVEVAL